MADPYALDHHALRTLLAGDPERPAAAYRADQVRRWLVRGVEDPAAMTDLPRADRERLAAALDPPPLLLLRTSTADGGLTVKVLLGGADGEAVESVLMLYPRTRRRDGTRSAARATVCISTQAGCAMGCPFCATGQAGFRRQLGLGEIVRQVTVMQALLAAGPPELAGPAGPPDGGATPGDVAAHVTNVVFMGMGEPLANLGPTVDAVRWLHGDLDASRPWGLGLSARSITVSTVGLVPGIRRLSRLGLPITLAVSLHAPDDALRDDLVPVNRQHPLAELLDACTEYLAVTRRRLTFEYVLIDGINTAPEQAAALARLVRPLAAHVNLIPMNPTPAVPWRAPPVPDQAAFLAVLTASGVPATIRRNRGTAIDAACGQLYADYALASGRTLSAAVGAVQRLAVRP